MVTRHCDLTKVQINTIRPLLDNHFDLRPNFGSYKNFFKKDYVKETSRDLSGDSIAKFLDNYGRDDIDAKRRDEAFIEDLKRRIFELELEVKKLASDGI